jgi:tRNA (mo5U34)-methyltransferase
MNHDELRAKVESFSQWHYEFDLDGITTPIFRKNHVIRHEQRERYFFDALVDMCGGSLKGLRVLDLGCNGGWWSLKAIEAGADFVAGMDGRQMHIDQANLVFEVKQVDPARYAFSVGNVLTDPWPAGEFDVVLCLGLLYHISKPVELMQRIAAANTDLLVIDTNLIDAGGPYWWSLRERLDDPRNTVDFETVLRPSRKAVVDLAKQFGYNVVPLPVNMTTFRGLRDYMIGERLAFLCAKRTDLSGLKSGPSDSTLPSLDGALRKSLRLARVAVSTVQLNARRGRTVLRHKSPDAVRGSH